MNTFCLKGEFAFFFIRELDVPPIGESNLMGPKKSVEVKFFTAAFFWGVPNVINNAGCTFLSFIANKKNVNSPCKELEIKDI